jgi:hypothetical protein
MCKLGHIEESGKLFTDPSINYRKPDVLGRFSTLLKLLSCYVEEE